MLGLSKDTLGIARDSPKPWMEFKKSCFRVLPRRVDKPCVVRGP